MALLTPRRLVAAALGAAALLAAMPAGWQRGWTPAVGALLWLPARPMAYGLSLVRVRLRAPDDPYPARPEELRTALESADRLQGELDAERLRADRLEAQLRELSEVVERDRRGGWRPILATVVERNAGRPPGLLGLDAGAGQGIAEGDPVVTGGNRLVGRIAGGVGAWRSFVVPLDDRRSGRIDALVVPAEKPASGAGARDGILVQVVAKADRTLEGELESNAPVKAGDAVVLSDATWPHAAQGMRLGLVESVGPLDSNPLRRRITVRMEFDPARLSKVTVKTAAAGGAAPASGAPAAPAATPPAGARKKGKGAA